MKDAELARGRIPGVTPRVVVDGMAFNVGDIEAQQEWSAHQQRIRNVTDAELVRLCAEKVFGATEAIIGRDPWGHECVYFGVSRGPFDPLNNDTDSCAVLDKMAADGFRIRLLYVSGDWGSHWVADFCKEVAGTRRQWHGRLHVCRRHAVVIAALKACGVEVEG